MAYNRPDDPLPSDPLTPTPTPTPDPLTPPPHPSYVKWLFTVAAVLVLISMKTSTAVALVLIMKFFMRKQLLYGRMGNGHSMEVEENGENGHSMEVEENGENGHSMEVEENGENGHSMDILDLEELNCLEDGRGICTYTKKELAKATGNFKTKVGQGVSGFVYRANLPGNRMGAVKKAHKNLDLIGQELFKQELSVLLRLPRHPHLVDLIGLCLQEGERILVFEFISNGNLHDRLHKNKGVSCPLSWAARMDIAYQVAVALQYLHEEAKPPILHRDVKSANVLLVDDHCAKLADFGLSKLGPKNNQFTITAVRGSYGYMDPQYMKTHRFSAKSDVYSFGVLLMELMTGFKSLHEDTPLAEWTQTYRLSEDIDMFMTIVDRNMMGHINTMELQNMIKVANLCLRDLSEERSSMREIVNMMQETRNINSNENLSEGAEAPSLGNGNVSDGCATAQC